MAHPVFGEIGNHRTRRLADADPVLKE